MFVGNILAEDKAMVLSWLSIEEAQHWMTVHTSSSASIKVVQQNQKQSQFIYLFIYQRCHTPWTSTIGAKVEWSVLYVCSTTCICDCSSHKSCCAGFYAFCNIHRWLLYMFTEPATQRTNGLDWCSRQKFHSTFGISTRIICGFLQGISVGFRVAGAII